MSSALIPQAWSRSEEDAFAWIIKNLQPLVVSLGELHAFPAKPRRL
jgi:hypothetical protein